MSLKPLLAGAALALSAGLAAAASIPLIPNGPGTSSAVFAQTVDGLFIDSFSFTPEAFDGQVSISLFGISGPISFFTARLNGQDFAYLPETGATKFSFDAQVTGAMPLSLTVFGAVLDADGNLGGAGVYSLSVSTIAAVPEPQSYAMLLAGLLTVGGIAARRARG